MTARNSFIWPAELRAVSTFLASNFTTARDVVAKGYCLVNFEMDSSSRHACSEKYVVAGVAVAVAVDRFYLALFSALEQSHCARIAL